MWEIFTSECRYQLRSPLFLILASLFFLFAFVLMGSEAVRLGGVGDNLNVNAAWTIVFTQFFFSTIGLLACIAIVAQAITRDYELKTAELIFCTGVHARAFLLGRFAAGCLFAVLVGVAALLGTLLATFMPWLDQERVGTFSSGPYLYAALVVTLPNFFVSSALFFAVAALTRSMLAAFAAGVAFFVLNIVVGQVVDPEQTALLAFLDPFGSAAFTEVSRYWTVFERNVALVPLTGHLLANRIVWLLLAVLVLAFTVWRFRFNLDAGLFARSRRAAARPVATIPALAQVTVHLTTGWRAHLAQFASQLKLDVAAICKSVPFYAVMLFATLNVWGGFATATSGFGIPLLPTTSALLQVISQSYTFFLVLIIVYYAGEVVHRERQTLVAEMVDALPVSNGSLVLAKIGALWFIVTLLLLFAMFAGALKQLVNNYFHIEVGLYLKSLLFVQGGFFYAFAVLAVFVQTLCGNKWLGMAALVALVLVLQSMGSFGFEHALYTFGPPGLIAPHSDMNGYGHYWPMMSWLAVYWFAFCGLLVAAAHLLYPRGREDQFARRMALAQRRLRGGVVAGIAGSLAVFVACGTWIYYNTNVLNEYVLTDTQEERQAEYERRYKPFELMPLPEVVAVDAEVDLFPGERRVASRGRMTLSNVLPNALDELFVSTHPFVDVETLRVEQGTRYAHDALYGVHRFKLDPPLQPGASVMLEYDLRWVHKGFPNTNINNVNPSFNRVVANGTFIDSTEIIPSLGYNSGLELSDPNRRRELDLPPIIRLPKIDDPDWLWRSQLGGSRRSNFSVQLTTDADQVAVAPGYLVGEVEERDGRRVYRYAMDEPIWPFFSFSSARYAVARDQWQNVAIEVYHHPSHDANVEPMLRGTKKSLDYFAREFAPYQYRQFRILEFPRYATFAQSFPNTVPYSEAIGFVADLRDAHELDMVFYVTAHELAHQWWGHQVAGAQMQGMTVIVETLAQYSALMVMEREYGRDKMRRFLRYELDNYLRSRGAEQIEELPLELVEDQPYIHYRKGSLVMYALKDAIGEDRVNLALRNFLGKYAYGQGPFPTSRDLVAEFRAVAPPAYQSLITDLFEEITIYDLRVAEVTVEPSAQGWSVRLDTRAAKYHADGAGRETVQDLDLWVDVGVFPQAAEDLQEYQLPPPLYLKRHRVTGDGEIVISVSEQPARAGIDPYNTLIDRNPDDNLKTI